MGADIHGRLEMRNAESEPWEIVGPDEDVDIRRSYDSFGLLFDVRNYANFEPLAPHRGFPMDAAPETRHDYERWGVDAHSASWLDVTDIERVDMGQRSIRPDARIYVYSIDGQPLMKFSGSSELTAEDMAQIRAGETVTKGERVYRAEYVYAGATLGADWLRLFEDMRLFAADRRGPKNVRLVVWFDN